MEPAVPLAGGSGRRNGGTMDEGNPSSKDGVQCLGEELRDDLLGGAARVGLGCHWLGIGFDLDGMGGLNSDGAHIAAPPGGEWGVGFGKH
jgi:hypothetical protein